MSYWWLTNRIIKNWGHRKHISSLFSWSCTKFLFLEKWVNKRLILYIRSHSHITTEYLWKDGIHLQDLGTNILSSNFITFVNSFLIDNDNNRFWLNHSHQTNDLKFEPDLEGLINLRRAYQNNPLIAYLNINSLREKIISLREILKKTKIDVLCIDEAKLDSSFPNHEFKIEGYQFPPLKRDRNS